MEKRALVKYFLRILVFGIFVYQMQNSILKYMERPIVQRTSTVKFEQIKNPEIYICQQNQFNYSLAREFGYRSPIHFYIGNLTEFEVNSWRGKNGDNTTKDLIEILFNPDYTFSSVITKNNKKGIENSEKYDKVFIAPQGFCMKLKSVKSGFGETFTTTESSLFLVDPFRSSSMRLIGHDYEVINFGNSLNDLHEGQNYEIEISLHDSRINDGLTCTDYDKYKSSYGHCTENMIIQFMLKWFGCVLPWVMKSSYNMCDQLMINNSLSEKLLDVKNFIFGIETIFLQPCKKPCQTIKFHTKRIDFWKRKNHSALLFNIVDEVTIYTDTVSYDMFSLVVDLGSALGLWLGLSAVSIFDNIIDWFPN